jgi:hypothetical protein
MGILWGLVIAALGLLAWGGQTIALLAPERAAAMGLADREDQVDPAFYADGRGEALADIFTLWTLLAAGILLIFDAAAWPYLGLVGGAIYVYFAGRGVFTRRAMQRRGIRIGAEATVKTAFIALGLWGVAGLVTVVASIVSLAS